MNTQPEQILILKLSIENLHTEKLTGTLSEITSPKQLKPVLDLFQALQKSSLRTLYLRVEVNLMNGYRIGKRIYYNQTHLWKDNLNHLITVTIAHLNEMATDKSSLLNQSYPTNTYSKPIGHPDDGSPIIVCRKNPAIPTYKQYITTEWMQAPDSEQPENQTGYYIDTDGKPQPFDSILWWEHQTHNPDSHIYEPDDKTVDCITINIIDRAQRYNLFLSPRTLKYYWQDGNGKESDPYNTRLDAYHALKVNRIFLHSATNKGN